MTAPRGARRAAISFASAISGSAKMLALTSPNRVALSDEAMAKPVGGHGADMGRNAVEPYIQSCDRDRLTVDVRRHHGNPPQFGGGDGEDAGASADIENGARPVASRQLRQGLKTTRCRPVMAGAERGCRLDLDGDPVGRAAGAVMCAMNEEAADADRTEPGEALRHPVLVRELFDIGRGRPADRHGDAIRHFGLVRRVLEIGGDRPRAVGIGDEIDCDAERVDQRIAEMDRLALGQPPGQCRCH